MRRRLRFAGALLALSCKASFAARGAFLLQVGLMIANNFMFFTIWLILYGRYDNFAGTRLPDMLALFGAGCAGFGLAVVTCGGMLELARTIEQGELDALLVQPKSVLVRALCSRSIASGWGDLVSGFWLMHASGYGDPASALLTVVLVAAGYAASAAVLGSSAFWLGRSSTLAHSLFEFVITFTLYPPSIFGQRLKLVLYTLLPAGLIVYLPVEYLHRPGLATLTPALLGTLGYVAFASLVFERGLRHYTSGNRSNITI